MNVTTISKFRDKFRGTRYGKNVGCKEIFASWNATSKSCNCGINYDTELKFGDFSYLIDMLMYKKMRKVWEGGLQSWIICAVFR